MEKSTTPPPPPLLCFCFLPLFSICLPHISVSIREYSLFASLLSVHYYFSPLHPFNNFRNPCPFPPRSSKTSALEPGCERGGGIPRPLSEFPQFLLLNLGPLPITSLLTIAGTLIYLPVVAENHAMSPPPSPLFRLTRID